MKVKMSLAVALLMGMSVVCKGVLLSEDFRMKQTSDAVVTVSTYAVSCDYPVDAPQPLFWFDANDTTGWEFTNYNDNASCVHTIPSRAGSKLAGIRWLSTDVRPASAPGGEDGDEWYGWWATDKADCSTLYVPLPPVYRTDDATLVGGRCVDFLSYGSRRALVFNAITDDGCDVASNSLKRIGTVIAVYGSQNGGGWFLGGGGDGSFIRWHRASSDTGSENSFMNPVLRSMGNSWALNGVLRHDGLPTSPAMVGFNGGWEVLSWIFTSPDGMTHGPGVGDGRGYGASRTGGQRIAEMIFYDAVLTLDDVRKVEAYLQRKWFGRSVSGCGGNARLSRLTSTSTKSDAYADGVKTELAVGDGESLAIDVLDGGRGRNAAVRKSGSGTLRLGDTSGYGGTLELAGGTLDYKSMRTIPTVAGLPRGCFAHFDASATDTMSVYKEDGDETLWFNGLANLAPTTVNGNPIFLGNYKSRRGWVVMDYPSAGLNVIDLGDVSQYEGRYLLFTGDAPSEAHDVKTQMTLSGVTTLIAVMHARGTGPNFGNTAALERNGGLAAYRSWYMNGLIKPDIYDETRGISGTNGVVYINGIRVDPSQGLISPGFQVVAIQTPGASISRIGVSKDNQYMGGIQLGEMLVYRRPLDETEILDVSAYLLKKWLGRTAPGYANESIKDGAVRGADIRSVTVADDTVLAVAGGRTVRVEKLEGDANLVKKGAGTLDVGAVSGSVSVVEGALVVSGINPPISDCELAANPLAHFDPNNGSRQLFRQGDNGRTHVAVWEDETRIRSLCAWSFERSPWIENDTASTNRYLNFGPIGSGGFMFLDTMIDSARSIYVVWRPRNNTELAQMLGTTKIPAGLDDNCDTIDQLRGERKVNDEYPLFRDTTSSPIANGEIYTNGIKTTRWAIPSTNAFELIEVHTAVPAHLSAIASDRSIDHRYGGSDFGDILVYDRPLSAKERVATRNYLMRKWFNATPQPLLDGPVQTNALAAIDVSESAIATISSPTEINVATGAGQLSLNADSSIGDLGAFTGVVSVATGATLSLPKRVPRAAPHLVTEGRIAHFDMSDTETLTLVDKGSYIGIAEWRSKLGDGIKAVAGSKYTSEMDGSTECPQYRPKSLNGMATMLMQSGGQNFMLFEDANGETNDIENIRTVFWVFGTVNNRSGGFLLGGGRARYGYFWHRGGLGGSWSVSDPLTCGSAASFVYGGRWWKNGDLVDASNEGLDADSWHYISFLPKEGETGSGCATGFAFDGRILTGEWNTFKHRTGNQNLAEVIIYDRVLSEEERISTEAYLAAKWGLTMSAAPRCGLSVSSGATLDLEGLEQTLPSLSGAGVISNGVLSVEVLTADCSATEWASVIGTFRILPRQKVSVVNWPYPSRSALDIKILNAASFDGVENIGTAVFDGMPSGMAVRLRVRKNGDLIAHVGTIGTLVIMR